MKSFAIVTVCALAVLATACEQHPASQLPQKHGADESHPAPKGGAGHESKPADHSGAATSAPAKPEGGTKPGEAPKFFPENR